MNNLHIVLILNMLSRQVTSISPLQNETKRHEWGIWPDEKNDQCCEWFLGWPAVSKFWGGLAIVPAVYIFNHWIWPKVNWFSHLNLLATVLTISGQLSSFRCSSPWVCLHPASILLENPFSSSFETCRIQCLLTTAITLNQDTLPHVNISEPPHWSAPTFTL